MELILAIAIGVLFGSGIWLILRPRTFQLITGLMLMSYAVNLFIFAMGRLWVDKPPITPTSAIDPSQFADPLPQATGADRDRDRLCHHRAVSCDDDRRARTHRQRPRRRQEPRS
jgi:hypothetical protein